MPSPQNCAASPVCIDHPLPLVWIHVADFDLFKVHTLAIDAKGQSDLCRLLDSSSECNMR